MKRASTLLTLTILFIWPTISMAQFTTGNVVVLQVGTGTTVFTNTTAPVILKEYNTTVLNQSSPVSTISIPTSGPARLTVDGAGVFSGLMTLSEDSTQLVIAGYDAPVNTSTFPLPSSTSVPRSIDTVSYAGTVGRVDTTMTAFSSTHFYSAARNRNENYWGVGANTGIYYMGKLAAKDTIYDETVNISSTFAANGKLYFCTSSGLSRIGRINGQPTSGMVTADTMITTGGFPQACAVNSTETIVYVADSRNSSSGGGIQKWTRSGATWSLSYTLASGGGATPLHNVIVDWSGTYPVLYAVYANLGGHNGALIKITDSNATAPPQILASLPLTNTAMFRSVAFAPRPCTKPVATLSPVGTISICSGDTLTLHTNNNPPGLTYTWKLNGALLTGPGSSDSVLKVVQAGVYEVIVNAGGGCRDTSGSANVTVRPLPIPTIVNNAGTLSTGSYTTYQWYLNGTILSGAIGVSFTPSANGKYMVCVVDSNGCKGCSAEITISGVGVEDLLTAKGILLYPNPVNSELHISTPIPARIVLRDVHGRVVKGMNNDRVISLATLSPGVYAASVYDTSGVLLGTRVIVKRMQ